MLRRCLITRPSTPLTRPSALSPHSAASSMLATAAVAVSCFSTKSRNEPRPPRIAGPPAAVPPETAVRSRHALSRQPYARRSRNRPHQSTQRETATVIQGGGDLPFVPPQYALRHGSTQVGCVYPGPEDAGY